MKKLLIVSFLTAWSLLSFAQKGTIRGTVIEEETGEPLFRSPLSLLVSREQLQISMAIFLLWTSEFMICKSVLYL